jgi:hypothetical protein
MTKIPQIIQDWCDENGYTDPFLKNSEWWGFPANAVMPVPLPDQLSYQAFKLTDRRNPIPFADLKLLKWSNVLFIEPI